MNTALGLAVAGDIDALTRLEEAFPPADRISRRSLRRFLSSPTARVLVARQGRRVVGAALLLLRRGSDAARLYSIAVAADTVGKGIGSALLERVAELAASAGASRLRLEVRASNVRAVSLYSRAGFETIGEKPGYYGDGEAAIHMERKLPAQMKGAA